MIASDHDEELPPLSPSSIYVVVVSPRATAPAILPAPQRLTQIPRASRGPTGRTRATSKHHWKLELQERADATKEKIRAKREATKVGKNAKLMAPRKEDGVSNAEVLAID